MKFFSLCLLTLSLLFVPCMVQGGEETTCTDDVLFVFFPKPFVKKTLADHHVPDDKQEAIATELLTVDGQIKTTLEEKASKMNPNPLKDRSQREKAAQLFSETLSEVFSNVLKKNGVTDDKEIDAMLVDIQNQRIQRFNACRPLLEKKISGEEKATPSPAAAPVPAPTHE